MVKVTVVGNCSVGKTTLTHKMVYNKVPTEPLLTTIGADFHVLRGKCSVHIWDTGNLERFGAISSQFYARTRAFLIVYDNESSVSACAALSKWHTQLSMKCDTYNEAVVIAVRAKADLIGTEPPAIVKAYCHQHQMEHVSVSARNNINVDALKCRLFDIDSSASSGSPTIMLVPKPQPRLAAWWTCPRCTS